MQFVVSHHDVILIRHVQLKRIDAVIANQPLNFFVNLWEYQSQEYENSAVSERRCMLSSGLNIENNRYQENESKTFALKDTVHWEWWQVLFRKA